MAPFQEELEMVPFKGGEKVMQSMPRPLRTRFAPSPTGYLHLGHVLSAMYVWGIGRALGASIILRLEDHDQGRCNPKYEKALLEDLQWLGFIADEGVTDSNQPSCYRQSDRSVRYLEILSGLQAQNLVYACDCSRQKIRKSLPGLEEGGELFYNGFCRNRNLEEKNAGLRLRVESFPYSFTDDRMGDQFQDPALQCGDLLIRDRHGNWTYPFAVSVDDLDQGINLVVRGEDLLHTCARQRYLQSKISRALPEIRYFHHPLIYDRSDPSKKLSKTDQATGIGELRKDGLKPEAVLQMAACGDPRFQGVASFGAGDLGDIFYKSLPKDSI